MQLNKHLTTQPPKMKKIAVVSYHTCPLSDEKNAETGGMNTYVLELNKALAAKGYVVDIFTRCFEKESCNIIQVMPNLRVIHIKAGQAVQIRKKELPRYIPEFTDNLLKFIQAEKSAYSLISAHYFLSGQIGLSLKRKLKVPLFVTFHTLALMKNLVARSNDEKEELSRISAELKLVSHADKIIATSDNDIEYLHTLYGCPLKKIALLSPGVNLELFRPINKLTAKKMVKAGLKEKIILFVGRITPLKGIDVLLYALKIVVQKNPKLPVSLWVVGERSNELKRLKSIGKLLGIEKYVKFTGQKYRKELPYYYNLAEMVIMPSWYESFGQVALEAMACRVPVISSDVSGVSKLLDKEHNQLLISANNPIGLSRKISLLLTNKSKHESLSSKVFKRVQNLSWDHVANNFTNIS